MTKAALAVLILVGALTTAGCSSAAQSAPAPADKPTPSETTATATFEPVVPDATAQAEAPTEGKPDEAEFLRANRASLHGVDSITDEQLLAAGYESCRQVAAGALPDDVEVFAEAAPGEPVENWNDANLAGIATVTLCTEYSITN